VLGQIGQLELEAGNLDAAESHLDEALTLCRRAGNRRVEVQVRYRLCGLQMAQDRLDASAGVLTELLEIVRADHDVVGEGRILHRLGQVNARRGRLSEAATALRGALEVRTRLLDRAGAATISREIDTLQLEVSDPT
jgi:tetratricopeptide (TPR) repeat protein